MLIRRTRLLRHKHRIPLTELAKCVGISHQRMSQIELGEENTTVCLRAALDRAFRRYIRLRREALDGLEADYRKYKGRLPEYVEADPVSVRKSGMEWDTRIILNEASRKAVAGGPFWIVG